MHTKTIVCKTGMVGSTIACMKLWKGKCYRTAKDFKISMADVSDASVYFFVKRSISGCLCSLSANNRYEFFLPTIVYG